MRLRALNFPQIMTVAAVCLSPSRALSLCQGMNYEYKA